MAIIDIGGNVRNGEELDIQAVETWLKNQQVDFQGQVQVTQYSGGASNWTYRLKYDNVDLILRRPPKGTKAKSAHDMAREYHVQNNLKPFYPVLPEMVALCQDESVIGCDFYVMKRIEGIIPRANLPKEVVQTLVNEGYPVYDTKLSPSIIMKQSHHQSLPLIYLDAKHKLTQQYAALYQEIESR